MKPRTYAYQRQFDLDLQVAARKLVLSGHGTSKFVHWTAMGTGWGLFWTVHIAAQFIAPNRPWFGAVWVLVFILAMVNTAYHATYQQRFAKKVERERLCFHCGYALKGQPVDDDQYGRCPECAEPFHETMYIRPPKRYHVVRDP